MDASGDTGTVFSAVLVENRVMGSVPLEAVAGDESLGVIAHDVWEGCVC